MCAYIDCFWAAVHSFTVSVILVASNRSPTKIQSKIGSHNLKTMPYSGGSLIRNGLRSWWCQRNAIRSCWMVLWPMMTSVLVNFLCNKRARLHLISIFTKMYDLVPCCIYGSSKLWFFCHRILVHEMLLHFFPFGFAKQWLLIIWVTINKIHHGRQADCMIYLD